MASKLALILGLMIGRARVLAGRSGLRGGFGGVFIRDSSIGQLIEASK